jgi:hypothetical protein
VTHNIKSQSVNDVAEVVHKLYIQNNHGGIPPPVAGGGAVGAFVLAGGKTVKPAGGNTMFEGGGIAFAIVSSVISESEPCSAVTMVLLDTEAFIMNGNDKVIEKNRTDMLLAITSCKRNVSAFNGSLNIS